MLIRTETKLDYEAVKEVSDLAFNQKTEGRIIEKLRQSKQFIPELSLAAQIGKKVVGYIILYPVTINKGEMMFTVLSLGPMAVRPEHQRKGVGEALITEALLRAKDLGFKSVIVAGQPDYFPRFGFTKASKYGIKTPFEVPEEAFLVKELVSGSLQGVSGVVDYPEAFNKST